MMPEEMTPEELFFRYAFPCTEEKLMRGKVTHEEYENLRNLVARGETPSREELSKVYQHAFKRLELNAETKGFEVWSKANIRGYFLEEHNKLIDAGEGEWKNAPQSLRDLCKVKQLRVKKAEEKSISGAPAMFLDSENGRNVYLNPFQLKVKDGDTVSVHYYSLCEIL